MHRLTRDRSWESGQALPLPPFSTVVFWFQEMLYLTKHLFKMTLYHFNSGHFSTRW